MCDQKVQSCVQKSLHQFPALANAVQRSFPHIDFGNKNITRDVCGEIWCALAAVLLEEFAKHIKPGDAVNGTIDFCDIQGNRGYLAFILIHTSIETKKQKYLTLPHHAYKDKTRENIKLMLDKVY